MPLNKETKLHSTENKGNEQSAVNISICPITKKENAHLLHH